MMLSCDGKIVARQQCMHPKSNTLQDVAMVPVNVRANRLYLSDTQWLDRCCSAATCQGHKSRQWMQSPTRCCLTPSEGRASATAPLTGRSTCRTLARVAQLQCLLQRYQHVSAAQQGGLVVVVVVVAPSQARYCQRYEPAAAPGPDKRMQMHWPGHAFPMHMSSASQGPVRTQCTCQG
jgi:hypothetical protein